MADNNDFLSNYNKREETPAEKSVEVKTDKPSDAAAKSAAPGGFKYEQKSAFKPPEKKADKPASTGGNKTKMILAIVIGAVLVLGAVLALVLLLGGGFEMIDLVGWTQTDAQLWANENGVKLQTEEAFDDVVAAGTVISQETPAKTRINKGDFVKITVSKGHDLSVTLTLPDLMAMTNEEVAAWAEENYMTKVRITTEYSTAVAAGKVIRFEINDNTVVGNEVRRDTPIYVIVSKGIDDTVEQITIPDFKTMSLTECYAFAKEKGLVLTVEEQYDDFAAAGTIISQSIKAAEKVYKGSELKLVASKGKKIVVPDFSEFTKEMAQTVATGLGIPATVVEKYSGSSAGAFLSQSLSAGEIYKPGDFLELKYSLGNKIVLASYVGQTRDALETWAKALNEQGARITINATYTQSNSAAGTIVSQDKSNTTINVKTTINITVSKGKVVYVPDFSSGASGANAGYNGAVTREIAIKMCETLNIIPVFVEQSNAGALAGAVWNQSVPAGTEVAEGTTVTLIYAPVASETVPNFLALDPTDSAVFTKDSVIAKGYLTKYNITFVTGDMNDPTKANGQIVGQSLVAYTVVPRGSVLTLTINPDAVPAPTP